MTLLALLGAILAVGGVGHGASSANIPIRGCAGIPADDGKTVKPQAGCAKLTVTGASIASLSAAGNVLYLVAGQGSTAYGDFVGNAIETFRVTSSGAFSRIGCFGSTEWGGKPTGCVKEGPPVEAVNHHYHPEAITLGPSGLYATAGGGAPRVDAFVRRPDGSLSFVDCIADDIGVETECSVKVEDLARPGALAASPDNKRVYSVATYGIWSFERRPDGGLAVVGCTRHMKTLCKSSQRGEAQLDGDVWPLAVSPDSRYVYVLGSIPTKLSVRGSVTVYERLAAAPGLRLIQSKLLPQGAGRPRNIVLSRNGGTLYTLFDAGLIGLKRGVKTGRVSTITACLSNVWSSGRRVPGCRFFPGERGNAYPAEMGKALQLARTPSGSLVLTEEVGVWLLGPGPGGKGLRVTACARSAPVSNCPRRENRLQYSSTDAAVLANGRIVVTNEFTLFSMGGQ